MCVEFQGPTHRPIEQSDRSTRQLDAFAVLASAIWKWAVAPCWTDGQSDHAAIVASLHRRRTADSGVMSPRLVKNLPSAALNDLRSRFGLLERFFGIPNRSSTRGLPPNTYRTPRGPGIPPADTILEDNRGAGPEGDARPDFTHEGDHPRITDSFRQDSNDDQAPPLLLGLLNHGRTAMEAMIQGWWRTWRRHEPASLGALLQEIGQGTTATGPTGVLRDWLVAQGWQGDWIQADEARRWKLVWAQEQAQEHAGRVAPWASGPSGKRNPLADHFRIGRSIFGRLPPIHGVRDEQGRLRTDPREMDDVLWRSREAVWATTPPAPDCGHPQLLLLGTARVKCHRRPNMGSTHTGRDGPFGFRPRT